MKNNKSSANDIAVSRVVIMLFSFAALAILARIYIIPFQKHYLVINNYYRFIEYATMTVTFICSVLGLWRVSKAKKSGTDISTMIFTPAMFTVLAISAFATSVFIPFSNNRTLAFKYSVYAFIGIAVSYAVYYLVNRAFSLNALVCTLYCILFAYSDFMYTKNVTFSDKISLSYSGFIIIFVGIIVIVLLSAFLLSKKNNAIKLFDLSVLSLIAVVALIVRVFVINYVSMIAIILEIAAFVLFIIKYKFGSKMKR